MAKGRQSVRLRQGQRKAADDGVNNDAEDAVAKPDEKPFSTSNIYKVLGLTLPLLTIAALNSVVSQDVLSPVYGRLPASVNHAEAITATVLLGFIWRHFFGGAHEWSILPYLTLWAFYKPVLDLYLMQYSGKLGPILGCIITGFLGCHTLIIPSAYAVAHALEVLNLQDRLGAIASYAIARYMPTAAVWAPDIFTPVKLQYLMGLTYGLLSPSKPYWMFTLGLPSLIHAFLANPHFDSPRNLGVLNRDLAVHNWTVLDRQWSSTGYVSVAESLDLGYRVLRCDHSLLGGEWLLTDERRQKEGWQVNEPIYAVFQMLEAVRLIIVEPAIFDSSAQALVIGLGVGTAPKAMIAHGINTTTVELDPAVHHFAKKYFELPDEHTVVLQDAVSWAAAASATQTQHYEYIIHDVFTGGAEPLSLFTDTFVGHLRSLLTANGVVAINYAGRLELDLTKRVLSTIYNTFDGHCKVFRDAPKPDTEDFMNLIIFCRNSPGSISFREPTASDYLGSKSRKHYLLPKSEYEIPFIHNDTDAVLTRDKIGQYRKDQEDSAIGHWYIMRKVLPDVVWEMW
ncbi:hypothetical protein BAUCODRAFT_124622 [Baudoinia panamericana UAMH 10762]|uniref:PABS domain-containing protein n=1 Tax=Baudoinia panamericana (strain UAMH 10762) TaxID=717646 RepID=M2N529_BAUPA|nr:uncharacterized protein BAUCODRAFT_124622 [Baudoinia panamericana UAMH 10762]EMC93870.1 hypothetical protein BAUCODRAFT_124622 [Baudoinia panamericana UAMH 10762]